MTGKICLATFLLSFLGFIWYLSNNMTKEHEICVAKGGTMIRSDEGYTCAKIERL